MSTYIKKKQSYKRRQGRAPIIAGDIDSARAVTNTKIAVTQRDGSVVIKQILESLDAPYQRITDKPNEREEQPILDDYNFDQMDNMSPPPPSGRTKTYRVSPMVPCGC
jgi:hypothetical protein